MCPASVQNMAFKICQKKLKVCVIWLVPLGTDMYVYIVLDSLKLRLLLCKLDRICQITAASDEVRKLDFVLEEQCSLCFLSLCTKLIVGSLCEIDFCSNRYEIFAFLAVSLIFVYIHTLYESSCARFAGNITVAGILCNE